MRLYFSGFCLKDEKEIFAPYIIENDFTVSGFSFGAQKALEYVLNIDERVDKLQLFSPAFFQDKDQKYKRLQLMFFKKDAQQYCKNFLANCTSRSNIDLEKYFSIGSYDELESLLTYTWDEEKLKKLVDAGVDIEVYLGSNDEIIDSDKAKEFFKQYATVYFIKKKGHIL